MTFDVLPTLGIIGNKTFTEGTPVVLDSALTIADADGDHLMNATVKTFGGFAGDGNTLTFSTARTSIGGARVPRRNKNARPHVRITGTRDMVYRSGILTPGCAANTVRVASSLFF